MASYFWSAVVAGLVVCGCGQSAEPGSVPSSAAAGSGGVLGGGSGTAGASAGSAGNTASSAAGGSANAGGGGSGGAQSSAAGAGGAGQSGGGGGSSGNGGGVGGSAGSAGGGGTAAVVDLPSAPFDETLRKRAAAGMTALAVWYDTNTGLWNTNDWWTSANQLETVIDYSRETGDPTFTDEIDNTFVKNQVGNFDHFGFYDDDGWWAITWIKAYDLSHQDKYLAMAKAIFQRMAGGWDDKCGGGIYWASAKAGSDGLKNKNAIPNSLFLQVAAKLHLRTPGDTGPGSYLDWAQREWAWFKGTGMLSAGSVIDSLNNLTECKPVGPVFTYNQGVLMGGLVDLAAATGDATLLDQANVIAQATMTKMVDAGGTLKEAPCGGDICTQFKGVFMRNLALFYRARPSAPLVTFMRHQSDQLWDHNKNGQNQFGYEWYVPFDKPTASRQSSALDALVAAVASSNLNLALVPGVSATSSADCSPAEAAIRAIDGSSRWGSKWCGGGASAQTLTVDLGAVRTLVGFRLRHAGAGGESAAWNTRDFELDLSQNSADNAAWTRAVTVKANVENVTTHGLAPVKARYVRLHVTQAQTGVDIQAARLYELEVFGQGL